MGDWRQVRIGDFLHRVKQSVQLRDDENYKLVTVRMHHNGVVLREMKKGELIGSNMYRVKSGQFILSGIDARHGAFGVVPEELDDAIVTNDFWYFDVDENVVSRDFFLWLTTTPLFLDACIKSSEGTTNRRRLQGDKFFNFSFHFPEIDEQKRLAKRFNAVDTTFAAMKDKFEQQSKYLKQLRQAVLQEAVEGKLTSAWRKQHPVVKGDPQYDAAALLAQIKNEKERLVKEGKIRKEKPLPLIADEDKPFDLPDGWVWCKLGEVIGLISGQHIETNLTNTQMKGLPYLTGPADFGSVSPTITKWTESPKVVACEKDILITVKGSGVGKTNILNVAQAVISRQLMAIRPQMSAIYNFTYLFIQSIRLSLQDAKDGLIPGISRDHLLLEFFPLPPLAEQQAVVARVDSLMSVIDELEKQVAERKEQAQLLMQTVLREAFDGESQNQVS